jgi:hypothetical protein
LPDAPELPANPRGLPGWAGNILTLIAALVVSLIALESGVRATFCRDVQHSNY